MAFVLKLEPILQIYLLSFPTPQFGKWEAETEEEKHISLRSSSGQRAESVSE